MLNLFLLSSVLVAQQTAPAPSAGALISKMFARYNSAKTLSGTVKTTQTAGTVSVITDTTLAYERPAKIRLDQVQVTPTARRSKMMVSDGVRVAYTTPERLIAVDPYFVEPVTANDGTVRSIGDLYPLIASELPDRSPLLDALIARNDDLRYFKNQLAVYNVTGRQTIGDKEANVIEGDWRETEMRNLGDADRHIGDNHFVKDTYKLYITDAGDLVRYELIQHFAAPTTPARRGQPTIPGQQISVSTVWEATISVNGPIAAGTFALRTKG